MSNAIEFFELHYIKLCTTLNHSVNDISITNNLKDTKSIVTNVLTRHCPSQARCQFLITHGVVAISFNYSHASYWAERNASCMQTFMTLYEIAVVVTEYFSFTENCCSVLNMMLHFILNKKPEIWCVVNIILKMLYHISHSHKCFMKFALCNMRVKESRRVQFVPILRRQKWNLIYM